MDDHGLQPLGFQASPADANVQVLVSVGERGVEQPSPKGPLVPQAASGPSIQNRLSCWCHQDRFGGLAVAPATFSIGSMISSVDR